MQKSMQCHQERLEQLLEGMLTNREESLLLAHLDHCGHCRNELSQLAASPELWSQASQFLKDDQHDQLAIEFDAQLLEQSEEHTPLIAQVLNQLQPTDDPAMLGRLGMFEIKAIVGAGGMGVVLKAQDPSLDRIVAIKAMAPHLAFSGAARQRFAREARAAAAVIHPNVIAIHSVAADAKLPYLVMSYVAGYSLQKRVDQEGALPLIDILRIGIQTAAGLSAAHRQGLVHRDIKPANILLEQGVDRLVITDFGLARTVDDATMTRTGVIAGTPQYMSPEQARGEALDARSDLFSLGSVLYTVCTGRCPFRASSALAVLRRITDEQPRQIREINPNIPEWLTVIIARLHEKSPVDRFQNAEQVADLLSRCLAHLTNPAAHQLPIELNISNSAGRRNSISNARFKLRTALVLSLAGGLCLFAGWKWLPQFAVNGFKRVPIGDLEPGLTEPSQLVHSKNDEQNPQVLEIPTQVSQTSSPTDLVWDLQSHQQLDWYDHLDPVIEHLRTSLRLMNETARAEFDENQPY